MARAGRRAAGRGNLIAKRLDQVLRQQGQGSMELLLARLHLQSGRPGFAELAELDISALSRIRHAQRRVADFEVVAIAEGLDVSVRWLLGLIDDPTPESGQQHYLDQ